MEERLDRQVEQTAEGAEHRGNEGAPQVQSQPPPKGIPPVAEALGYVGGALALSAVIALLATFWPQLGIFGHFAMSATLAVVGLVGGFMLRRNPGSAAQRLSQFLLLAGVVGVGAVLGFATRDVLVSPAGLGRSSAAQWGWFAGALGVAVSGGLVWARTRTLLQHVVFAIGVGATALLALPLVPFNGPEWGAGLVLMVVSLTWGALSLLELLPPHPAGLVLSAAGIVAGAEMMALAGPTLFWALWLGAAVCVAVVALGSVWQEYAVLGIGAVGLTAFCGQLIGEYVGFGAGTAMALIVLGFIILGFAIRLAVRMPDDASTNRRVTAEVGGYLGIALAMGGAGVLVAQTWEQLGTAGRIAVPLVGALVAYAAAFSLDRTRTSMARRLEQVLLAIGVLSTAITAAMVARPIAEQALGTAGRTGDAVTNWAVLTGAAVTTLVGGIVWYLRKGSLTQIAFFSGVFGLVITGINFTGPDQIVPTWVFGALLAVIGLVWTALGAAERLLPVRTALSVGCLATFMGLQMMVRSDSGFHVWAGVLAIAVGIGGIAASIYLKRGILLGFGAVTVIVFTLMTVMTAFEGTVGAPILLLIVGVVFIAVAVVAARAIPRIRRTPNSPGSEDESGITGPASAPQSVSESGRRHFRGLAHR